MQDNEIELYPDKNRHAFPHVQSISSFPQTGPSPLEATPVDPILLGKYLLLEVIGRGGMAVVFRARQVGRNNFCRIVALKLLHDIDAFDQKQRMLFSNEARILACLRHPNIVSILEFDENKRRLFLAMEYVDGPSLSEILHYWRKSGIRPTTEAALAIIIQVCRGVAYVHEAKDDEGHPIGIIHRDLTPTNIMLDVHEVVKLMDFGVARANTNEERTQSAGVLKGKLRYMSPEQAQGILEIDHRSDIFAIGLILYELLAGRKVYEGNDNRVLIDAQMGNVDAALDSLPEMPHRSQLLLILQRTLAAYPDQRFQTATSLAAALEFAS